MFNCSKGQRKGLESINQREDASLVTLSSSIHPVTDRFTPLKQSTPLCLLYCGSTPRTIAEDILTNNHNA